MGEQILPEPNGPPFGGCVPCAGVPYGPPSQIPGPQGVPGNPGSNGLGLNAFTYTTGLGFTVPAPNANVTVPVGSTSFMAVGQILYIQSAGYYKVASIQDLTDIVLTCLNYTGDAAEGTAIASAQPVVPAGLEGPAGETGSGVTSVGLSVPTGFVVTGSPVTTSGTIAITTDATTLQNLFLASPSTATGAPSFRTIAAADLPAIPASTALSGQVPIANGGTGQASASAAFNALSPTTTKGDIIVSAGGTGNVRLPVGTNGQVLTANSSAANGADWENPAIPLVTKHRTATVSPDAMLATDAVIGINLGSAFSETLLAAPADGREIIVKDESGAGATNNITVYAGAGDTIQGASTHVISTNYGFINIYYNATSKIWFITGSA
jgi:hypothetical protein